MLHMILMERDSGHAMCLGHSLVVTENCCEVLSGEHWISSADDGVSWNTGHIRP